MYIRENAGATGLIVHGRQHKGGGDFSQGVRASGSFEMEALNSRCGWLWREPSSAGGTRPPLSNCILFRENK
jgi:hypothetical protein